MIRTTTIMLIFCIAFGWSAAQAQSRSAATEKGALMVGGAVAIASQGDGSSDRITTIAVAPSVLSFVSPGFGLGADLSFTSISRGGSSTSAIGVGPKLGYFFDSGSNTIPYLASGVSFLSVSNGSHSTDGFRVKFAAGLLIREGNVGFNIEAGYVIDDYDGNSMNTMQVGVGLTGLFF